MRWFALLYWLGFAILGANAQRIDLDFSGAAAGSAKVDRKTGAIHFSPVQDIGLPRWYFRIQGTTPGQTLKLVAPSSEHLPSRSYLSDDAGKSWVQSAESFIDEASGQTRYEITAKSNSLLFSSHLPSSHAFTAQWMDSLAKSHGIEILPFGPTEAGLSILRFCEGDRVEARRPVIWIQSGYRSGEGAACWTAMAFCRWLAGVSSEAVFIRQNMEVLVLPLMYAPSQPMAFKETHEAIDTTVRAIEAEERSVTRIELRQGDTKCVSLEMLEVFGPIRSSAPKKVISAMRLLGSTEELWQSNGMHLLLGSHPPSYQRLTIPWNLPAGNPSHYEALGVALGEAIAAADKDPIELMEKGERALNQKNPGSKQATRIESK